MARKWLGCRNLLFACVVVFAATTKPVQAQTGASACLVLKAAEAYQYIVDPSTEVPPHKVTVSSAYKQWSSPDQAYVVVYRQLPNGNTKGGQLVLRHSQTEKVIAEIIPELEVPYPYVEWASDSRSLIFGATQADNSYTLTQITPLGILLGERQLAQPPTALLGWSEDNGWYAYTERSGAGIHFKVWSVEQGIDLTYSIMGVEEIEASFDAKWSPKGTILAISVADTMRLLEIEGLPAHITERHRFTIPNAAPELGQAQLVWSPDGTYVGRLDGGAFDGEQDGYADLISIFGVDGTQQIDITQGGYFLSFSTVDWLSDHQILMARRTKFGYDLYGYDLNSRKPTLMIDGVDIFYSGGFGPPSPNVGARWLLTREEKDNTFSVEIYDREHQRRIPLVTKATHILASRWRGEQAVVVYAGLTTDEATMPSVTVSQFAQDGRLLSTISHREWNRWQPWGFIQDVTFSYDGHKLFFLLRQANRYEIASFDLETGEAFTLLDGPIMQETAKNLAVTSAVSLFHFSSDGERVAFPLVRDPTGFTLEGSVVMASRAGILSTDVVGSILGWSPEGQYLIVRNVVNKSQGMAQIFSILNTEGKVIRTITLQEELNLATYWMPCSALKSSQ